MNILAGFEVPSGRRVEIPERGHLAWFGQTQLSGKTTALEAFVARGGFKAVAFVTKRGESSFLTGRTIAPFFSEPTNDPEQPLWRWVKSILEASQQRKMRFEESWIIEACEKPKQAVKLADVHENIIGLLRGERDTRPVKKGKDKKERWLRRPVSGMNQGVYTSLNAYFNIVMPQLARLPYSKKIDLRPGLNVMDLREYSLELQALVIRSVMEYVYLHERNTRVIVPEAQDFVPEGRNSPVKMACENMVRKGAADGNFMWLDSQDMAAVDKTMLRQVSIMGCGVQGEINEIERTVRTLFGSTLKPHDIGRLKVGEFYIRLPGGDIHKTYVQPAWMDSEVHAQAIAKGDESVSSARAMLKEFQTKRSADGAAADKEEELVYKQKYEELQVLHDDLKTQHKLLVESHDGLAQRLAIIEDHRVKPSAGTNGRHCRTSSGDAGIVEQSIVAAAVAAADGDGIPNLDEIYQHVIDRARKDPGVLQLLTTSPELRVTVERRVINANGDSMQGKMAILIADKFFDKPRSIDEIRAECLRRGFFAAKTNNAVFTQRGSLSDMLKLGFFTLEAGCYQVVPGMKVHIQEAK